MTQNVWPMDREQSKAWSAQVVDMLVSQDEGNIKKAAGTMTDILRLYNRETSFAGQIIEPEPLNVNELVPSLEHDQPVVYGEMEPDSPGAFVVDFGYLPNDFYPYGRRYPITIQEVQTDRVVKNVMELMTYKYDFRTVISDQMTLQLAYHRDSRLMRAVNRQLSTEGTVLPWLGKAMHQAMQASLDYESFQFGQNILRATDNALEPSIVLFNHLMIAHFKSFVVNQFAGTEVAVDMFRNGFSTSSMDNLKLVATIKKGLVPNGALYFMAAQQHLGRYIQATEPTMVVKNEGTKISFYQYEHLGMGFPNQAAFARANYRA